MDVTLQRHCAKFIYVIPDGLKELISDISREVLRSQPEDIYMFVADYLDALLITRENARVAIRLVNTITEIAITTLELLTKTGIDYDEAEKIVTIMNTVFKRYMGVDLDKSPPIMQSEDIEDANVVTAVFTLATIPDDVAEEAAHIIQNAFRKFKARREIEKKILQGMVDWRIAARSAIYLYRKTGVTKEEADRAATLIKAAYKGYFTRRLIKKLSAHIEPDSDDETEQEEKSSSVSYEFTTSTDSEMETQASGMIAAKEIVSEIMHAAMHMIDPSVDSLSEEDEFETYGITTEQTEISEKIQVSEMTEKEATDEAKFTQDVSNVEQVEISQTADVSEIEETQAAQTEELTTDAEQNDAEPVVEAAPIEASPAEEALTDAEHTDADATNAEVTDAETTDVAPTDTEHTDAEPTTDAEPVTDATTEPNNDAEPATEDEQ